MSKKNSIDKIIDELNLDLKTNNKSYSHEYQQVSLQTTNKLFIVGDYIFKNYSTEQAYITELSIYSNRELFSFRIPNMAGYYKDGNGEFWLVMDYIRGVTLSEYILSSQLSSLDYQNCINSVVENLCEFESKASKLQNIGINKPSFYQIIEPLFELLQHKNYSTGISSIKMSLLKADCFLQQFPSIPYFDCSLHNIIVPQSSLGKADFFRQLVYIDFDKSYRSTVMSEQLSHLLLDESLKKYKETILLTYSQIGNMDLCLVKEVTSVCVFIRSLSWLRYSLQWIFSIKSNYEIKTGINTAKWALIGAFNALEDFSLAVDINSADRNSIVTLLSTIYSQVQYPIVNFN